MFTSFNTTSPTCPVIVISLSVTTLLMVREPVLYSNFTSLTEYNGTEHPHFSLTAESSFNENNITSVFCSNKITTGEIDSHTYHYYELVSECQLPECQLPHAMSTFQIFLKDFISIKVVCHVDTSLFDLLNPLLQLPILLGAWLCSPLTASSWSPTAVVSSWLHMSGDNIAKIPILQFPV